MKYNAWIAGSTGLVGNELANLLHKSGSNNSINLLVRRKLNDQPESIVSHLVDFNQPGSFPKNVEISHVYICLGTTIKKAGSQEAFTAVDYEYVIRVAKWAKASGAESCSVISSVGASSESSNFYLRTKGEMEEALKTAGFKKLLILRPSLLLGNRKEFRIAEKLGSGFAILFSPFMIGKLKRYKAVQATQVAKAMLVGSLNNKQSMHIMENEEILKIN